MHDLPRAERYRRLFARLDRERFHELIDKLQVLALTNPDTLREFETFLERDTASSRGADPPGRASAGSTR